MMKATMKKYPKYFLNLKQKLNLEIKRNNIIIARNKYRTNVGKAWPDDRKIKIPIIKDIESVYIVLHEIAHVILNHGENCLKPTYIIEMEAERHALSIFKKWDIHKLFPEDFLKIKKRAERYVRWNIIYEIQRSLHDADHILQLKNINITALRFSNIRKFQNKKVQLNKNKKTFK